MSSFLNSGLPSPSPNLDNIIYEQVILIAIKAYFACNNPTFNAFFVKDNFLRLELEISLWRMFLLYPLHYHCHLLSLDITLPPPVILCQLLAYPSPPPIWMNSPLCWQREWQGFNVSNIANPSVCGIWEEYLLCTLLPLSLPWILMRRV